MSLIAYFDFRPDMPLSCDHCGWTGKAGETLLDWTSEVAPVLDRECPQCLTLLLVLRFLPRGGRIAAVVASGLVVCAVALARVVLGVHFVSDVLAGITLGITWVAVTTWAYVAWRRETDQPVEGPAEVGTAEQPPSPSPAETDSI